MSHSYGAGMDSPEDMENARELTHTERVIDLFADWRSNYRPGGPTGGTEGEHHDAYEFVRFVAKTIGVSSTDLRRIAKQNDSDARREEP